MFGGNINSFSQDIYNEKLNKDFDFENLNFNSFVNSFVFFFVVSLNNDWPILANLCVINNDESERRFMKLIFTLFKLIVNYILLNSIIAFTIEIFYNYEKKLEVTKVKDEL